MIYFDLFINYFMCFGVVLLDSRRFRFRRFCFFFGGMVLVGIFWYVCVGCCVMRIYCIVCVCECYYDDVCDCIIVCVCVGCVFYVVLFVVFLMCV